MSEWEVRPIEELVSLVSSGGTPRAGDRRYYAESGTPFLKIDDITRASSRFVDEAEQSITHLALDESAAKIFPVGTVLVTMYGTMGVTKTLRAPMATNQAIAALVPPFRCDTDYLAHALSFHRAGLERLAAQTTQPNLSGTIIRRFMLPVPPLEEQRRIAEILDTIDETIQATERVVAKLQRADSAALTESVDFGRNETQLGDVCSLLQDGTHLPPPRTSEGPLLLSVQNLRGGELRPSARDTHIPEAFWRGTRRALPIESGDICLAVVGTLGKLGVVPPDLPPFTVQRSLTVLRGDPMRIRNDYLFAVMRHGEFQRRLWQRANQTAQPGVYLGELRTIGVPSPPLDEQRRVAEILDTIGETIRANEERRDKLRKVRSGLAADLLSGRVRTVVA